jgi:PmbA protein
MTDRQIDAFKNKLFEAARNRGFTDYEIYYSGGASFSIKVFDGEIREYKNSLSAGLSFRGTYKGKMGYAFTERVDDEVIPFLIENAAQNAEIIEDPDVEDLYAGSPSYPEVKTWDESLGRFMPEEKISRALKMEKAALEYDRRVEAMDYCMLGTGEQKRYIANSLGLNVSADENSAYAYAWPRVRGDDGQVKTNGESWVGKEFNRFDPDALGKKAAEKALAILGAKSVPTGAYKIIFDGNAMEGLLSVFSKLFSAENVQKGFSLLKNKIGKTIAADAVSLRDDPLLDGLPGSASFDDEGVAAKNKAVIEKGVLKTYLHNRKTAKKDGVEPTGNGFKASFKTPVGIVPANFYIAPGDKSQNDLLTLMDRGLLICGLEGLHSGADSVSGNFSVSAEGFLIENGKALHPVEQITVAGNFLTLLKDITAVGNDLEFKGPISSPSVLVRELSVAGRE